MKAACAGIEAWFQQQRWLGCALAALAAAALVALAGPQRAVAAEAGVTPQQIVIGQSIKLQGDANRYGSDVLAGVQVLFDQVNRVGGVHGSRIALRQNGPELTRASLVRTLEALDLGGLRIRWRQGEHTGSVFVDLAMVTREGRFLQ